MDTNSANYLTELHQLINQYFNLAEIQMLCLDLHVDFESVAGEEKPSRIRELLLGLGRNGRLSELITLLQQERPLVEWRPVPDDFELPESLETGVPANQYHVYGDVVHGDKIDGDKNTVGNVSAQSAVAVGERAQATINQYGNIIIQTDNFEDLPPAPGEPPYKGMAYFAEADKDLFFGREKLSDELADKLQTTHFLAVIGASGSGKSSLLRAGIIPRLRVHNWCIHIVKPGVHPLTALATNLTQDELDPTATDAIYSALATDANTLHKTADKLAARANAERILLAVDQFEELFTQCSDAQEQQAFVNNLVSAAQAQGATTVLLSMRADFYGRVSQYSALTDLISQQQIYIKPMAEEDLVRAIAEPAKRGGWQFVEGLVEQFVADVGNEPGRLPLLSHALLATWQRRRGVVLTLGGYRDAGGVKSAIAQTAEATYTALTAPEQAIAQRIFLRLTELGKGTEDTRRRVSQVELGNDDAVQAVTQRLIATRLITTTQDDIDVAHEALIREWPRLREWLDADREGQIIHHDLTDAEREWRNKGKDSSLLYRGLRLEKAEAWERDNSSILNDLEKDFLQSSKNQRGQEELIKRATIIIVFLFLTAVFFAFQASSRANETQQLKNALLAKQIITSVQAEPLPDGEVALLLATASLGLNTQVDTQDSLYKAFFSQHRFTLFGGIIPRAVFSPNGEFIMAFSVAGAAKVWRLDGTEVVGLFEGHTSVTSASFSPNSDLILTASLHDGNALVRKLDGTELGSMSHLDGVHSATFSPTGNLILTTGGDGTAKIWELDGTLRTTLAGHTDWWVSSAAFNSAGDRIVTAGYDHTAKVWTIDGVEIATLSGHTSSVSTAVFNPSGDLILTTSADGTAKLWQLDGTELATLAKPTDWVRTAAFSPDGKLIVIASDDSTAKIWGVDGTLQTTLAGHTGRVTTASFNHTGDKIVTASDDGTAKVWTIDGALVTTLKRHTGEVASASFNPIDDSMVVTTSVDGTIMVWELHDDIQVELIQVELPETSSIEEGSIFVSSQATFSPTGDMVLITLNDEAFVWKVDGTLITRLVGHTEPILSAAFHPEGSMIVTTSRDKTVKVWGIDGELLTTTPTLNGSELSASFNSKGNLVITSHENNSVKFWQVDGTLLHRLEGVRSATFSPVGDLLITIDLNQTAKVWAINDSGQFEPIWHADDVSQATFSPTNNMIVTVSNDGTATVWGSDGEELAVLIVNDQIETASFNPLGNLIVTTGGPTRIWGLNGVLQTTLPVEASSALFSPTEDIILTVGDNIARIWGDDGRPRATLSGHSAELAIFSPLGNLVLTVDGNGGAKLWPTMPTIVQESYSRIDRGFSETECQQYFMDDLDACPRTKEELFTPLAQFLTNP